MVGGFGGRVEDGFEKMLGAGGAPLYAGGVAGLVEVRSEILLCGNILVSKKQQDGGALDLERFEGGEEFVEEVAECR